MIGISVATPAPAGQFCLSVDSMADKLTIPNALGLLLLL